MVLILESTRISNVWYVGCYWKLEHQVLFLCAKLAPNQTNKNYSILIFFQFYIHFRFYSIQFSMLQNVYTERSTKDATLIKKNNQSFCAEFERSTGTKLLKEKSNESLDEMFDCSKIAHRISQFKFRRYWSLSNWNHD